MLNIHGHPTLILQPIGQPIRRQSVDFNGVGFIIITM